MTAKNKIHGKSANKYFAVNKTILIMFIGIFLLIPSVLAQLISGSTGTQYAVFGVLTIIIFFIVSQIISHIRKK